MLHPRSPRRGSIRSQATSTNTTGFCPPARGQYHSIGVHRVVQVVKGKPIASHNAVLLAHGNAGNFNSDFMAGTYSPQSLFVYLASNGIDVWSIDYGWALVPASESNFTFMQNWACNGISTTSKPRSFLRALSAPRLAAMEAAWRCSALATASGPDILAE